MVRFIATILATLWLTISAVLMQEAPPLPEGSYCTPQGIATSDGHVMDPAHPCHCEHMTYSAPDCEGPVQENGKCRVYCKPKQCHCPVICKMPVPQEPEEQ